MAMVAHIISAFAGLYGLGWLVFTFREPPSSVERFFRPPGGLYFLPDKGARFVVALACFAVAAFSSVILGRWL